MRMGRLLSLLCVVNLGCGSSVAKEADRVGERPAPIEPDSGVKQVEPAEQGKPPGGMKQDAAPPSESRTCEPGETQECLGAGRCEGAQSCSDSGDKWLACECEPAEPDGGKVDLCEDVNCGAAPCVDGKCKTDECDLTEKDSWWCTNEYGTGFSDLYLRGFGCTPALERKLCKMVTDRQYCCSPTLRVD
jgi:hypothetical protein